MHNRLVQLERLVSSLMPGSMEEQLPGAAHEVSASPRMGASVSAPDVSKSGTPQDERSEAGSMRISHSELRYVSGEHWAAIMESIADLKQHFDGEDQLRLLSSPDQSNEDDSHADSDFKAGSHAMLLYGCEPPSSRTEIFDALPPKNAIDRYMARYFNLQDLVSCSVHGPTFLTEYERFWDNPSSVSIVWVGLLFSMICLAVLTLESAGAEQQSLQIGLYRKKIVQCLLLGEYTKAGPYALEALIHYVYVEFAIRADADKDIWFLLGLEVNLAMRMGYHRDPSHFLSLIHI